MSGWVDELRQLRAEATEGPWGRDGSDRTHFGVRTAAGDQAILAVLQDGTHSPEGTWADAEFIAEAANLWPLLLDTLEAAERSLLWPAEVDTILQRNLRDALQALRVRVERDTTPG